MRIGAGSDLDLAAMLQTCSNPRRPRRCWPSGATALIAEAIDFERCCHASECNCRRVRELRSVGFDETFAWAVRMFVRCSRTEDVDLGGGSRPPIAPQPIRVTSASAEY